MPYSSAAAAHREWAQAALFLVLILGACGPSTEPPSESTVDSNVVARFGDHEITVDEVDAHVLALPPDRRPAPGTELDAWYAETLREMMVDELLRAEAAEANLHQDPAFLRAREEAEKQLGLQLCVSGLRPELDKVSEKDLQAAYEARAESFDVPERRFVYHLFLRRSEGASAGELEAEIEELRDRALRGESFSRLAEAHSDSESRHREGLLGWVTPGVLPAGFEKVIFALPEGVPSEPVETRDGLHIFFVDQVLPRRTVERSEVRSKLTQALVAERRLAALEELEAEIEVPEGSVVLDREAFSAAVKADDPEAVVLRIGETELDLGDLRQALGQQRNRMARSQKESLPAAGTVPEEAAWRALEQLRRRELIHHHCRETNAIPAEALAERLETWSERNLLQLQRRRRMIELAERDEDRLRLFYQSNIGDFSSRPAWHVRRLKVPLDNDPAAAVARLEDAAASGRADLEALAAELGGEVEDLGFLELAGLGRLAPKLPSLVSPLEAGEAAPPYRQDDRLEMVEVVERRESEPLAFEDARDPVAAAYVNQYTRELYDELTEELLGDGSELEIDPEALASLREAGLPRPEVSVDELEALLEEL